MDTRRYGWTPTARLRRYPELGDNIDARAHPDDYRGPGAVQTSADQLTAAAAAVEPLLDRPEQRLTAAEQARAATQWHDAQMPRGKSPTLRPTPSAAARQSV